MAQGNGPTFAVHMATQTKLHLKHLHIEADHAGRGAEFVAAFRHIVRQLQQDPWTFGEPTFRLPALKLQVRTAANAMLVVDYGVHEEKSLVFIRGFKMLS